MILTNAAGRLAACTTAALRSSLLERTSKIPIKRPLCSFTQRRPDIVNRLLVRGLSVRAKTPMSFVEGTENLENVAEEAVYWCFQNGLVMSSEEPSLSAIHAPISIFPSHFPRAHYQKVYEMMPLLNMLYERVSCDEDFLISTLSKTNSSDSFVANLISLLTSLGPRDNKEEEVTLCINRSDYMFDNPSNSILQVEFNTIASSFMALATKVSQLHNYISRKFKIPSLSTSTKDLFSILSFSGRQMSVQGIGGILENQSLSKIPEAIVAAHNAKNLGISSVVMMVVKETEGNIYDQQWLSAVLFEKYGVSMIRTTLSEMAEGCEIDPVNGELLYKGTLVSVVYYRDGYQPESYGENGWAARELVERSKACKCPTVAYHLAGSKKVQQELAQPGVLEKFITAEESNAVREVFAGLWSLDDTEKEETREIIKEAIANPNSFVLKPQREGGGNNIYGNDISKKLKSKVDLSPYILMQRIRPPKAKSALLRNSKVSVTDTLSELGIYGTLVKKGNDILVNDVSGHLLRTKVANSNEGGVAAGFAVLDSPYLI